MKEIVNIFSRHEIKYMITDHQRKELLRAIGNRMIPDPHGLSTICNVYYDTPNYRLIRRSLEKPEYKEKMRLRSYGTPNVDSIVFLELKKKCEGVVYKRRIELSESAAEKYMKGELGAEDLINEITKESDPQIVREIDYFKSFYGDLRPSVYLSYDRCAYFSKEDESLRITFDKNIRWRKEKVRLTEGPGGEELLPSNCSLMEIKTATALPVWLVEVLSQAKIRPSSFSKYGRAYQSILKDALEINRRANVVNAINEEAIKVASEEINKVANQEINKAANEEAIRKGIKERLGKDNDRFIWKRIYNRGTYSPGLYNQHSGSAYTWSLDSAGLLLSHSSL